MDSARGAQGSSYRRRGRTVLWSGLLCFAGLQLALAAGIKWRLPEIRDLEYGQRLHFLRGHLRQEPDRPLLLVVGGSRTGIGLNPESVPRQPAGYPLVFNYGLDGADPLVDLLCLRRLLADGVRPAWVVVEIMPPLLNQTPVATEDRWGYLLTRLGWEDLPLLWRYSGQPWDWHLAWLQEQLCPWYTHRRALLRRYAPSWSPFEWRLGDDREFRGRFGWRPHPIQPQSVEEALALLHLSWRCFAWCLVDFSVADVPDRALREMLALCRQEGLPVCLLLMPESSAFQSWYPTATRHELDGYLARVSREFNAPVVDARCWVSDAGFIDGHHLSVVGATHFTHEFHRRVVVPVLEGKQPGGNPPGEVQRVVRQ